MRKYELITNILYYLSIDIGTVFEDYNSFHGSEELSLVFSLENVFPPSEMKEGNWDS